MRGQAPGFEPSGPLGAANTDRCQHIRSAAGGRGDPPGDGGADAVGKGVFLTADQRQTLARVVAVGVRWTVGGGSGLSQEDTVAALRQVTHDGVVLGVALGTALAAAELDGWRSYGELAEVYRSAGADEQVAAAELAWRRDHRPRH
jgi:hypothetical protein